LNNNLVFSSLLALGAVAAGFLGSLTGLGGGVVLIPLLVLIGVDIHYAMGASLVSIIATSSGSAAAYVKEGYTNIRLGMFLEIATTFGAIAGAFVAGVVPASALAVVFGVVLLISALLSSRPRAEGEVDKRPPDPLATRLRLDSTYPTRGGRKSYHVHNIPVGFAIMFVAGVLSGLLGIGSGAFKVLAMDQAMRIPFKVSTTTSNFMIGVTAAASAGVYLRLGYIDPRLAMPVMLGVLLGTFLGTRVLVVARARGLRIIFGVVILALGAQMIYKGIWGGL
jgi:uncharacterized protein